MELSNSKPTPQPSQQSELVLIPSSTPPTPSSSSPLQNSQKQPLPKQQQQDLITDFSSLFKGKTPVLLKKPSKARNSDANKPQNWLLQIPAKLDITLDDIMKRRVMDQRKWITVVKFNTPKNLKQHSEMQWEGKMIAALCSCWNYLFSNKGLGQQKPLTIPQFRQSLSKSLDLQSLKQITQYTRLQFLQKIIQAFNSSTKQATQLQSSIQVKLSQPSLLSTSPQLQKQSLLQSLQTNTCSFIYLAYQDIFLPIGYDITFVKPLTAYSKLQNIQSSDQQLWIINSTLGSYQPTFVIKRWIDLVKDFNTSWPQYFDIKQHKQGVRMRNNITQTNKQQNKGTTNCIIKISALIQLI